MINTIISGFGNGLPMLILLAKATLILVLAIGVTIAMQRASAGSRHLVWLVTLAALLLVPALTAWGPFSVGILPAANDVSDVRSSMVDRTTPKVSTITTLDANGPRDAGFAAASASKERPIRSVVSRVEAMNPVSLLLFIWAAVVLAIGASLGYAALAVRRIVRHSRPLDSQDWVTPMWEVADRLGLDEIPRLLRSEEAKMPFACGVLKPTIVLPAECDFWTLDRRRAVLLHELAHVRRHDLIGHTLGRFACAFYWFHPLVWSAAKQLRSESERACDDLALSCGARATDYAEHLLDIVTSVRRDATPSVALAMARRKEFEGRMLAILDPELRHSSPTRFQSAGLIGSLAMISIIVGAAAPAPRTSQEPAKTAAATIPTERDNPDPIQLDADKSNAKAYPDSREVIGGSPIHQQTRTIVSKSEQMSSSMSTSIIESSAQSAVSAGAAAGVANPIVDLHALGANPELMLRRIIASGKGETTQKSSDERPVLLANVLRTDADPELRKIAAWGLAEYAGHSVADNALAEALRRDSDPRVREMAAWALGDGDNDNSVAVAALVAALRGDAVVGVRSISAWALGSMGARSAVDALAAALNDANSEIRLRAAWAIGSAEPKQAPKALINMLNDPEPRVRELAAWSLYQIEDPASIPALDAALRRETSKDLQIAYIKALAAIGEKSVDALRGLIESKDPDIRAIAVRALAGGHATGPWPWPMPEPRPFP